MGTIRSLARYISWQILLRLLGVPIFQEGGAFLFSFPITFLDPFLVPIFSDTPPPSCHFLYFLTGVEVWSWPV